MNAVALGLDNRDFRLLSNIFKIALKDRFLGSSLGLIWAVANPILMLGLFTFVFGFVFKSKLPGAETSLSYIIWLISGYAPWLAISEGISTGTCAVTGNVGLVKNMAIKTEILPLAYSGLGGVSLIVSLVYLGCLLAVSGQAITWSWILVIPVMVAQFLLVAGISLVLSSLNVFIRDVSVILPNILMILLFASPIFYPIEVFPASVQIFAKWNPFYLIAEGYRQSVIHASSLSLIQMTYLVAVSSGAFILGLKFFRKLKPYFDSRL